MNDQFLQRFEEEMQKIAESLTKKGGIKQTEYMNVSASSNKNIRPLHGILTLK